MNELIKRSLTGLIYALVVIGSVFWSFYSMIVFFGISSLLCSWEFLNAYRGSQYKLQWYYSLTLSLVIYMLYICILLFEPMGAAYLGILIPLVFGMFVWELFRKKEHPFSNISLSLLIPFYTTLPFAFMSNMAYLDKQFNPGIVIGIILLSWANDTFAYLIGRTFGRTKLMERISPKKTVEGSLAGLVSTILIAYFILPHVFNVDGITQFDWLIIGILIVVFGSLGDLVESMFKRSVGIKDSGKLLPGHGGFLDRFDALLLAVPFIYSYLYIVRHLVNNIGV
jgi:phosphatidate cytidylyltransferase